MSREAMQQALEALEQYKGVVVTHHDPESFRRMEVDGGQAARDAIDALRAALAEPEQEPVAYFDPQEKGFYWAKPTVVKAPISVSVEPLPLYSAPTPRRPLTNEEISAILDDTLEGGSFFDVALAAARAIERAHGIGEQT